MTTNQYYKISPNLWDAVPGRYAATVYGIDRMPDGPLAKYVTCCPRSKDDPAYYWAGPNFMRLVMPPGITGCCMGPQDIYDAVVWAQLPTWLTWARGQGYTFPDLTKLNALDDITMNY